MNKKENKSNLECKNKSKDSYYAELMKQIAIDHKGDIEAIHAEADALLLDIIKYELGFDETIIEFNSLEKYYA